MQAVQLTLSQVHLRYAFFFRFVYTCDQVCVNTFYLFARLSSGLGNSVAEMCFFFFLWNLEVIASLAVFVQVDILFCIIIVS